MRKRFFSVFKRNKIIPQPAKQETIVPEAIVPESIYNALPLEPRQTRVLELQAGIGDAVVNCWLRVVSIDAAGDFEALSYVWGDAMDRKAILCNGQTILITTNLELALRRLRSPEKRRTLWVDALSINQDDVVERSEQVRIMRGIFSRASRVVVWLGLKFDGDELVKGIMNTIYAACKKYSDDAGKDLRLLASQPRTLENVQIDLTAFPSDGWELLQWFWGLPWFRRVWCIQEIGNARDSLILCGDNEFTWEVIGISALWVLQHVRKDHLSVPPALISANYFNVVCMFESEGNRRLALLDLLRDFRNFQASDPRDKVFALLGLADWEGGIPPVNVDYSKSRKDVYVDVASKAMELTRDLAVLSLVKLDDHEITDREQPSWAPNWSRTHVEMSLGLDNQYGIVACGDRKLELPLLVKDGGITLRGLLFDDVDYTSDVMKPGFVSSQGTSSVTRMESYRQLLLDIWRECSAPRPPYRDAAHAIFEMAATLTAGLDIEYNRVLFDWAKEAQEQLMIDFLDLMQKVVTESGELSSIMPLDLAPEAKNGEWQRFTIAAARVCYRRRFFRTCRGHYGLGPAVMQEGDVVVVLYGGPVPYVLRPCGGTDYIFLGECYMVSLLNGRIFTDYRDVCEEINFCLD